MQSFLGPDRKGNRFRSVRTLYNPSILIKTKKNIFLTVVAELWVLELLGQQAIVRSDAFVTPFVTGLNRFVQLRAI